MSGITIVTLDGHGPYISRLDEYLDARSLLLFSQTCKTAKRMSYDALLNNLLSAVAYGDEELAKEIVTAYPELLLDASACVKDVSGKEIKRLTPLQAAICAGDLDIVQMIKEVLQDKIQFSSTLNFDPEIEINRQATEIYPDGIDTVEADQKSQAQKFKASTLNQMFATINAATNEQIEFELNTPGQTIIATEEEIRFEQENPGIISERRILNVALHNFRLQVAALSNRERIFNPFNLLAAFELYYKQFNNFVGNADSQALWNRRKLFWRQVVGYIQRHLPACYLQVFAQGIYYIVNDDEKLNRNFEIKNDKGFYMRAVEGDLNNLGYKYCVGARSMHARVVGEWDMVGSVALIYSKFIENKKIRFRQLMQPDPHSWHLQDYLSLRCIIL